MTFFGKDWDWNTWDYNIKLKEGGTLTGSGFISKLSGIQTNKKIETLNFSVKVVEMLGPISEADYLSKRAKLMGQ